MTLNQHPSYDIFLKWYKKFVLDFYGNWMSYIEKPVHTIAIYEVQLPDMYIALFLYPF